MIPLSANSFIVAKINLYTSQQEQNGHCGRMLMHCFLWGYFEDSK